MRLRLHVGYGLVNHTVRFDMCWLRTRRLGRYLQYSGWLGKSLLEFGLLSRFLGGIQSFIRWKYLEGLVDQLGSCLQFLVGGEIFVGWGPLILGYKDKRIIRIDSAEDPR